jgi:hypothetical protein
MEQVADVVVLNREVAFVSIYDPRQNVDVRYQLALGIVDYPAVLPMREPLDLGQGASLRNLFAGEIELAPTDPVDGG